MSEYILYALAGVIILLIVFLLLRLILQLVYVSVRNAEKQSHWRKPGNVLAADMILSHSVIPNFILR